MEFFPAESSRFAHLLAQLAGQRVAVLGHLRPDGDCIGSQVGLCRILRARGIDAICVNHHPVPPYARRFVGDTPFFLDTGADLAGRVAVCVDCADPRRMGEWAHVAFAGFLGNIDHHVSNTGYAEHNLIIAHSAATAEMLAGFFFDLGLPVDTVTAQALYLGIATDTGQFRYASTSQRTFALAARLVSQGASPVVVAQEIFERESRAKMALLQRFLASFQYHCGGRVCIGIIDEGAWAATGATKDDTEGLVEYARCIEGVEIGILLEETPGKLKGSFRAKDARHRVDELAKQFNGGGHAAAAGFNPEVPLPVLMPRLLAALEAHFARLATADGGPGLAGAAQGVTPTAR